MIKRLIITSLLLVAGGMLAGSRGQADANPDMIYEIEATVIGEYFILLNAGQSIRFETASLSEGSDPVLHLFSPSGDHVYYCETRQDFSVNTLYSVPTLGGTPKKLVEDVDSQVTFSPDGKQFVFIRHVSATSDTHVIVADSATAGSRARMLADSAVQVVVGQIQTATSRENGAWASQPGMIRVYRDGNNPSDRLDALYKLYSSDQMIVSRDDAKKFRFADEVPLGGSGWNHQPALYTVLNEPVKVACSDAADAPLIERYPILDPRAFTEKGEDGKPVVASLDSVAASGGVSRYLTMRGSTPRAGACAPPSGPSGATSPRPCATGGRSASSRRAVLSSVWPRRAARRPGFALRRKTWPGVRPAA